MDLTPLRDWRPPSDWPTVTTLDLHTEGEPLRVVIGGLPEIPGETVLARRRYARQERDALRTALMWEPRGHADMYGCWLSPPVTDRADVSVLFLHNEGFSTMCGHGIIAVATAAVEAGLVGSVRQPGEVRVGIDTPAGFVEAFARVDGGRVRSVRFRNVASWVDHESEVDVPGLGRVPYTLAFGGAFYAYVDAADVGLGLEPRDAPALIAAGRAIKHAVSHTVDIEHPTDADLGFLYGTIFVGAAHEAGHHSRNVCVFADGEVDRSPTGTGVSGRVAIHHARGALAVGEGATIESILGTTFTASVAETTTVAGRPAVIPEVEGRAFITGRHTFVLDPEDPLRDGFLVR